MNLKEALCAMMEGEKVYNTKWDMYEYIRYDNSNDFFKGKKRNENEKRVDLNDVITYFGWEIYEETVSFEEALKHMFNGGRAKFNGNIRPDGRDQVFISYDGFIKNEITGILLYVSKEIISKNWVLL